MMREHLNVEVLVDLGVAEVSVEEFEKNGMWGVKTSLTVQSPQGLYNRRHELHQVESRLADMDVNDPRRDELLQTRQHLKAMLDTSPILQTEEMRMEVEKTLKSDEALKRLTEMINKDKEKK